MCDSVCDFYWGYLVSCVSIIESSYSSRAQMTWFSSP